MIRVRIQAAVRALAAALLLALLAGCGGAGPSGNAPATALPAQPQPSSAAPATGATLQVGIVAEPHSLDPHNLSDGAAAIVYQYAVEGLVGWDKAGEITPVLATAWSFAEDGRAVSFDLRPGVSFHDGAPFNAAAVKANFDRILDPQTKLSAGNVFKPSVERVEVVDDDTVVFRLKAPNSVLIYDLANVYARMMSPQSLARPAEEIGRQPVGTGPFRVAGWEPGRAITLAAWDGYWGQRPALAAIVHRPIPDASARVTALEAGDIDVAYSIPLAEVERLGANPALRVLSGGGIEAYHFQFNLRKPALQDVRVRKALNLAVDKEAIARTLYRGYAAPLDSPLSPTIAGYARVGSYAYDPDQARALLKEAGADGLKLALWTTEGRYLNDRQLAEAVAGYLQQVGVAVEIVSLEGSAYIERVRKPPSDGPAEYDLALMNAAPGTGDADQAWRLFIESGSIPPQGVNLAFYQNPEVDALVQRERATFDKAERDRIQTQIQTTVWNDAVWLFLVAPQQVVATSAKVDGLYFVPLSPVLKDVRKQ